MERKRPPKQNRPALPKGHVILTPDEIKTVLALFDDWERIDDFETGGYSANPMKVNTLVVKLGRKDDED